MNREKTWGEGRCVIQFIACAAVFILLVAAKLLAPGKMDAVGQRILHTMKTNMDVEAVFSAVGGMLSGENGIAEEVYQAVFGPQETEEALTAEPVAWTGKLPESRAALADLHTYPAAEPVTEPEADPLPEAEPLVVYTEQNLPEHVSMEQARLGFDYCTPVSGTITSSFGYRDHPIEGEERFHYGVDLAAASGTAIGAFAGGTVQAVGESSSYGKYCIVRHEGEWETLYAHCSRITAASGASVQKGEKIGEVGATGMATGPHLHFELHCGSEYLNPIYYISAAV